jgi:hypothetical protein
MNQILTTYTMATSLLEFNNLNFKAMNRKASIYARHRAFNRSKNYHEEGIGTITLLMAAATVAIIFYSIYNAF